MYVDDRRRGAVDADRLCRPRGHAAHHRAVPRRASREPRPRRADPRTRTTAARTSCASLPRASGSSSQARPRFRAYAEAVEARLGAERVGQLRDGLTDLREAMEQEVSPDEQRDRLDVRRVREHVHRPRRSSGSPTRRRALHVAGERRRVARDVDERGASSRRSAAAPCRRARRAAGRRRPRPAGPRGRAAPRATWPTFAREERRIRDPVEVGVLERAGDRLLRDLHAPDRQRLARHAARSCRCRSRGRRPSRRRSARRTRSRARRAARPSPVFVCRNAFGRTRKRRPRSSSSIASSPQSSVVGRFVTSAGVSLTAQWIERTSGKPAQRLDEVVALELLARRGDELDERLARCCAPRGRRGGAGSPVCSAWS